MLTRHTIQRLSTRGATRSMTTAFRPAALQSRFSPYLRKVTAPRRQRLGLRRANFSSEKSAQNPITHPDFSKPMIHYYHISNIAILGIFPLALLVSPSKLVVPIDLGIAFLFPFHMHVALAGVITDYVPPAVRNPARFGLVAATVLSVFGLTRLALGDGITESVKAVWRTPQSIKTERDQKIANKEAKEATKN
eukprot:g3298.t1